jgi:hypothetical protein
VLAGQDLFERLPSALDAWCGSQDARRECQTGLPRKPEGDPALAGGDGRAGQEPAAGGPAEQFSSAANAVGVDFEDGDALRTLHGWLEARGEAP